VICSKTERIDDLSRCSVALAYLLAEDRYPPNALWHQPIASSRLLECEVWNRINARRLQEIARRCRPRLDRPDRYHRDGVPTVLRRAFKPFPIAVRTLDAIHLAAIEFIRSQGATVQLASYDERLVGAARLLGIAEWKGN
jgi:hypothetical protein